MKLLTSIEVVETWFNKKFGWFFTNGMKTIQRSERQSQLD